MGPGGDSNVITYKTIFSPIIQILKITFFSSNFGVTEDALALSKTLLNFIEWLLSCSHKALQKVNDSKGEPEFTNILDKACDVLNVLIENRSTRAMLHIAILDEAGE